MTVRGKRALGQARLSPLRAERPAHRLDLPLRRDLPKEGKGVGLVLPVCNSEAMNLRLAEIAKDVAPGRHAVLLFDQAGWHASAKLEVPSNITLMPPPAKRPELNPAENVWEFMRDNWLSNRIFWSYDDLLDHCCESWNRLIAQPWRIMSLGMRQWAHGF